MDVEFDGFFCGILRMLEKAVIRRRCRELSTSVIAMICCRIYYCIQDFMQLLRESRLHTVGMKNDDGGLHFHKWCGKCSIKLLGKYLSVGHIHLGFYRTIP